MAMAMARLILLTMALVAAAGSCSAWELNSRMPMSVAAAAAAAAERVHLDGAVAPLIHALRPLLGSGGQLRERAGVPCDSWLLGVEAHNVRDWKTVPAKCEGYVGHYMLGGHYRRDSKVVVDEAIAYAEGLKLAGNGKEVWVFDIDETSLSNLPYYAKHGFGTTLYNATSFNAYVLEGSAPALPDATAIQEAALDRRQAGVPHGPYRGPEGRHRQEPPPAGLLRLDEPASQAGQAQGIGSGVQVGREAEAGGRRVRDRRQHWRPVERHPRCAEGPPHLQAARPHVLHRLVQQRSGQPPLIARPLVASSPGAARDERNASFLNNPLLLLG